jgi:hypothetical protein
MRFRKNFRGEMPRHLIWELIMEKENENIVMVTIKGIQFDFFLCADGDIGVTVDRVGQPGGGFRDVFVSVNTLDVYGDVTVQDENRILPPRHPGRTV